MKKSKKVILIILIVIAIIVLLGTIFGIVDYNKVLRGKDPMFSIIRWSFNTFNVNNDDEEENTESSDYSSTIYSGLGYKIVACDFCEKSVYFMPFGIGTYPYSSLDCTKENGYNDKRTVMYTLMDGKVKTIYTELTIPSKTIEDEENYEGEFIEVNNITGCGREFEKEMDLSGNISYTTYFSCDLSKMSDNDIKTVYGTSRDSLEQTKREIIKNNRDMKCKE